MCSAWNTTVSSTSPKRVLWNSTVPLVSSVSLSLSYVRHHACFGIICISPRLIFPNLSQGLVNFGFAPSQPKTLTFVSNTVPVSYFSIASSPSFSLAPVSDPTRHSFALVCAQVFFSTWNLIAVVAITVDKLVPSTSDPLLCFGRLTVTHRCTCMHHLAQCVAKL